MSAPQLQHALALLIRLPTANRGEALPPFLDSFELTELERTQVQSLAENPDVAKFGHIMGSVREQKVTKLLKLSRHYLSDEALRKVWEDHFEPKATLVRFNQLPQTFLRFLLEDEGARQVLNDSAPPFIVDLLRFELAQAQFQMKHFSDLSNPPEGSWLLHPNFVLLHVGYDIQSFRARLAKEKLKPEEHAPEAREVDLLFIRKGEGFDCRIFEIDKEVREFLEGELQSPPLHLPRPASFGTLVALGLCAGEA